MMVVMVVLFLYYLRDLSCRETLILHLLELFKWMHIFYVIECVIYVEQGLIILQEAEKNLILWVLYRVISDVQMLQVLVLSLSQRICYDTQSFAIDITVS